MKQPQAPCKDCTVRHPACQSTCEEYTSYAQKYREYKEIVDVARGREQNLNNFKMERIAFVKRLCER